MRLHATSLVLLLWCYQSAWTVTASAASPRESPLKSSQQDRWDAAYRDGRRAPWDVGRPATDLKQAVEKGTLRPCRVVELGCGPGNDAIYLAGRGFDVTAIDIAPTALKQAEKKAREAGVKVRWLHADVLNPPNLEPFDLIYDRGCYHSLRQQNAARYVEALRRLSHPGTQILILAGNVGLICVLATGLYGTRVQRYLRLRVVVGALCGCVNCLPGRLGRQSDRSRSARPCPGSAPR